MRRCLVVDDSRVIRKVARRILEDMRFEIEEAADGLEALQAVRRRMPDAILLDWTMPVMSGIEFLRQLRQEPGGDKPTVVYCTTENDVERITRLIFENDVCFFCVFSDVIDRNQAIINGFEHLDRFHFLGLLSLCSRTL